MKSLKALYIFMSVNLRHLSGTDCYRSFVFSGMLIFSLAGLDEFSLKTLFLPAKLFPSSSPVVIQPQNAPTILNSGLPLSRELGKGEQDIYQLSLGADVFVRIAVLQAGVDIGLKLFSPDGKLLEEADSPNGELGPESIAFVAASAGIHRLEVSSLDAEARPGQYEIRIAEQRKAGKMERAIARADSLHRQAVKNDVNGEQKEASKLAAEALTVMQKVFPPEAPELVEYLLHRAQLLQNDGNPVEAEKLLQQAMNNKKGVAASDKDIVLILDELGRAFLSLGQYIKAEITFHRAVTIREKESPEEKPEIALAQDRLAGAFRAKGQYIEALNLSRHSLIALETAYGKENIELAPVILSLSETHRLLGDYQNAAAHYKRAHKLYVAGLGEMHPNVALVIRNLAIVEIQQGNFEKAEKQLKSAYEILRKNFDENHPDVISVNAALGGLHYNKGNYQEAARIWQQVLTLREQSNGKDHFLTATTLQNLAALETETGNYISAEDKYQRALKIQLGIQGGKTPGTATILSNLGAFYLKKGDYQKADECLRRACKIRQLIHGTQHPDFALTLNQQASLLINQASFVQAESLLQKALKIQEASLGKEHVDIAQTLKRLAEVQFYRKRFSKSEQSLNRALKISQKNLTADHPYTASILHQHGNLHRNLKLYPQAEEAYKKALEMWEKTAGSQHPALVRLLSDFAALHQVQRKNTDAAVLLRRSLSVMEVNLQRNLAAGSERQKLAYIATFRTILHQVLTLDAEAGNTDPQIRTMAFTALLNFKGRGLDEMADTLSRLRFQAGTEEEKTFTEYRLIRSQLSALALREPEESSVSAWKSWRIKFSELADDLEKKEARLSHLSAAFRNNKELVTAEAICRLLPENTSLVEFALYKPQTGSAKPQYAAWILHSAGNIERIDLGNAKEIDKAVLKWRRALQNPNRKNVNNWGNRLEQKVMRNIRRVTGLNQRILLSPDGSLNLIPFAALTDEKGEYLVSRYSFSYLTSGRDLLRFQNSEKSTSPAVIIADPNFDYEAEYVSGKRKRDLLPKKDNSYNPAIYSNPSLSQAYFKRLPGTAAEAIALRGLLPQSTTLTRQQATEAALKQIARPEILHIATHGFFRQVIHGKSVKASQALTSQNPLLRSGLALAGANRSHDNVNGDDDGILTAMEMAGLDLRGTKLVVLSACQTGVGKVSDGEGVYGLRRAIVLAGSESQIISLWSVSDEETRDLMISFYRHLLQNEGRGEALRNAQLQILRNSQLRHPFYWASFIQSGNQASLIVQK